jgi:hypothetical protein
MDNIKQIVEFVSWDDPSISDLIIIAPVRFNDHIYIYINDLIIIAPVRFNDRIYVNDLIIIAPVQFNEYIYIYT